MYICTQCGAEFEGNFCPECGTKRENISLCPRCFAEIKDGVKFCSVCGLKNAEDQAVAEQAIAEETVAEETAEEVAAAEDVLPDETEQEYSDEAADGFDDELEKDFTETEEQAEDPASKNNKLAAVRRCLYFAPVAAFTFLSVILWAFFAAPAATYDGISYGNIYKFAGDGEYLVSLNGCARALIAFAVIAVLFSAFALCARFLLPLAGKKFKISSAQVRLTFLADCAQCAVLLALFVIGAVICGKANSAVSKVGAAGPLVLSFSLFFLLVNVAAVVTDALLRKYNSAYSEAATLHENKIDEDARLQAEKIAEQLALTRESGEDVPVYQKEPNKKLAFEMYWLEKGKAFLRMFTWAGLVLGFALVMYNFHYDRSTDALNNGFLIVGRICVAAVIALCIGMLIHFLRPARVPDKKRLASLKIGYILRLIWSVLLSLGIFIYVIICIQAAEGFNGSEALDKAIFGVTPAGITLSLLFLCAVPFALSITNIVLINRADKKYFSRREDGAYDDGLAPMAERSKARKGYIVYMYDSRRNAGRAAVGKDVKTARYYKKERALLTAAAITAVFALAAVIFFSVIFAPRNIYKLGKIENLSIGDSKGYVYRNLGDPFDKEEKGGAGEVWAYCSDSLARTISEKSERLEVMKSQMSWENIDSIEKLQAEISVLQARLASRRCSYIYVTFQSDLVTELSFEKNRRYADEEQKTLSKITYACEGVKNSVYGAGAYKSCYYAYEEKPTVSRLSISQGALYLNVREYFTDGSLTNKIVRFDVQSKSGLQTVDWEDEYGAHKLYLSVR